jgi:lipopolysaccharide export system protein LptA
MNSEPRSRDGAPSVRFSRIVLVLAGLLFWVSSQAQFTPGMKINNFSASDPFPAPNHTQMRYVLTGAEGRPQSDGRILLTKVKFETFRVNGEREMIVEAPECIFDDKARTAGSAGKLFLQSGDGKLRVEGDGFGCQLAGKTLVISNHVQAVIQRPNTNANAAPLVITSRWLEFDAEKRLAIFHDDIRGDDPDFAFTCGTLTVSATTNQFDLIEARESLVITGKVGGRKATADLGVYRNAAQSVELIGNATWDMDGKSGRADHVIGLRGDGSFQADGKVAMKLPRTELGAATGFLSASNAPMQSASVVEVFADKFHWRSNVIVARNAVRIVDASNHITFSCDALEARQAANASEDETAVATGNVIVEREGANVRAERADYSKRAGAVVFTGNPHWWQAQIEGSAERVTFKTPANEVEADKDVAVKITIPGKGGGSPLAFFPQGVTNQTAQVIEVASQRLKVTEQQALFSGKVSANQSPRTGSEARLRSDQLEVLFTAKSNRLEAITATDNVTYEQGLPGVTNGAAIYRKLTCRSLAAKADPTSGEPKELVAAGGVRIEQPGSEARAEQAVYNRGTDILKLLGQPVIEMPQGTYTGTRELEWDNGRSTLIGSDYKITVKPEVLKRAAESQKLPGQ